VARKAKLSGGEILGWTLAGLTTGLLGGVILAAWFGRGGGRRIRHAIDQWRPPASPARNIATPARSTQAALDASQLRHFRIEVVGVMPGVVELHGWVPSRAIRASAARIASGVAGIDRVVNCILVQGEDDRNVKPARTLADQSA
jgi:BON domain